MSSPTVPLLTTAALACRRGDRVLFKGLDLQVMPGQVVWLRGANGRGKTSLLRLLAGLSTPEAGQIDWHESAARRVYVAHANALKEDLTVIESLRFLSELHGLSPTDADLSAALQQVGMATRRDAFVRTLSQGQRRRVALARLALDVSPSVWLLDEPFDALDADGVDTLNALLARQASVGGGVLLTSHQAVTISQPQPVVFQLDEVGA